MTEVRWLSDREQAVWRRFIYATGKFYEELERQLQRDSNMPHTYYTILVALSESDNRTMRMSDLADECRSSRSRLSHAVAKLEAAGWVTRRGCPSDKRGSYAVLTDAGFAAIDDAAPGHVEWVRQHLFDVLTEEQLDQLERICGAIENRIDGDADNRMERQLASGADRQVS
ncbi:MAG TPA: MarR family transcriptional regulator [Pseudonocardiaceae bacterium]|jgi:DNA-binding MarR family transcriptional regulator|nr:MarR family transcriptional regulator [Pseudonocardiaceae bacterium]